MSTSVIRQGASALDRTKQGRLIVKPRTPVNREAERAYVRFYAAAAIGLVLGGIQGVIQRLPGISDWLYAAGYGGHLITNLAQTHVIMVGAGTLTITGTMYYLLPRILNRPLYSQTLTNLSFWVTVTGVYGFYFVMLIEGIVLGGAVTRGVPYDEARHLLGAWYDAPTGLAGGIMGVGYWLFVANIYLTMRSPKSWRGPESFIAKYIFLGTTGLFIGTLQGFYQVMPWSVNFIRATGQAGEEIDPVAHAHMNMVLGVAVTLMGMSYYMLPRLLGKPIWNLKWAKVSFWFTAIGALGFWLSLITLGIVEGNIMIVLMRHANNLTTDQAYAMAIARVGIWHNLLRAGFGATMGVGFWSYIFIVAKTFLGKKSEKAFPKQLVAGDVAVPPPTNDTRFNAIFFFGATMAMLVGTIQGVIQILPFASDWLDAAGQAGDMITPLAHAQMNIIASTGLGLMALVYFTLPKLSGKQWFSQPLIRVSFVLTVAGIVMFYLSLLTLGFIESIHVHQLMALPNGCNGNPCDELTAFNIARADVGWAHPFWLSFSNVFIAFGYITYAGNVLVTLGPENVRGSLAEWILQGVYLMDRALSVRRGRQVTTWSALRWRTARAFLVELFAGLLGFVGAGWFVSGRAAFGMSLFFTWVTGWIIYVEWNLAAQAQIYGPDFSFIKPVLPFYFGLPLLSAVCAALTYWRRGLRRKVKQAAPAQIVESTAILIEDAPAAEAPVYEVVD
jgi:cytochrome c oxidase cbb3-type subunit 1